MYESFFGFRERPFDLSPSPRYLVMTESHREALRNLEYGIASRKGVTLLLGDAGSGKTSVLRAAVASQPAEVHCVHLTNPTLSRQEFAETLAANFRLSPQASSSKPAMLTELESLLRERAQRGETSVLLVDEAQSVPADILEEIRLLANIETDDQKLLSIVIAGQTELAERLNQDELRALKQRVALRCELRPLSRSETENYLVARMRTAGASDGRIFTSEAIGILHHASRGIPRTINVIADNSLLGAFAANSQVVGVECVQDVCRDFRLDVGTPRVSAHTKDRLPLLIIPAKAPVRVEGPVLGEAREARPVPRPAVATSVVPPSVITEGLPQRKAISTQTAALIVAVVATIAAVIGGGAMQRGEQPARAFPVAAPGPAAVAKPSLIAGPPVIPDAAPEASAITATPALRVPPASQSAETIRGPRPTAIARAPAAALPSPTNAVASVTLPAVVADPIVPDARVDAPVQATSLPVSAKAPAVASAIGFATVPALPRVDEGLPAGGERSVTASTERAQIQSILERYRLAFSALDVAGVEQFWPAVNARNLQRAFEQIESQDIQFDACATYLFGGSRAEVSCGGRATFVPKVGSRNPRTEARRWTFHLSRDDAAWTIDRVESR